MSLMVVDPFLADSEGVRDHFRALLETEATSGTVQGSRRVSRFLLAMTGISLAMGTGEMLLLSQLEGRAGLALSSLAVAVGGQLLLALIGSGLALWLGCRRLKPSELSDRRGMLVALLLALGVGLLMAYLGHHAGGTCSLGWLVCPVYLLWAWGSAASGS